MRLIHRFLLVLVTSMGVVTATGADLYAEQGGHAAHLAADSRAAVAAPPPAAVDVDRSADGMPLPDCCPRCATPQCQATGPCAGVDAAAVAASLAACGRTERRPVADRPAEPPRSHAPTPPTPPPQLVR